MDQRHMESPEHAAEREELVTAVLAACDCSGLTPEAVTRLAMVIGRLFDLGCEFELEATMGAMIAGRPGEPARYLDRLLVTLTFEDAEPLREEAARKAHEHELKHERSN